MVACITVIASAEVWAQSAQGAFNPQTQLQVGSTIVVRSVYAIASPRPRYQANSTQPSHWNSTEQNLPTYDASLTIDAQISGDMDNGGVQLTVQGGAMTINGSTLVITDGKGEITGVDRIMMEGTVTDVSGQSSIWRMSGLGALLNGALISELTGNVSIYMNGSATNLTVTCIATLSQ